MEFIALLPSITLWEAWLGRRGQVKVRTNLKGYFLAPHHLHAPCYQVAGEHTHIRTLHWLPTKCHRYSTRTLGFCFSLAILSLPCPLKEDVINSHLARRSLSYPFELGREWFFGHVDISLINSKMAWWGRLFHGLLFRWDVHLWLLFLCKAVFWHLSSYLFRSKLYSMAKSYPRSMYTSSWQYWSCLIAEFSPSPWL